jgi:hypothetical protein
MLVKKLWKRSFPGPVYRTYIHIFFATLIVITSVLEVRPDHLLKVNKGSFPFTDAKKREIPRTCISRSYDRKKTIPELGTTTGLYIVRQGISEY